MKPLEKTKQQAKVEKFMTKTEGYVRKHKRVSMKAKLLCVVAGVLLALSLFMFLFLKVSAWYDEHRVVFTFPIVVKFYAPIKVERRSTPKKQETPVKSAKKAHTVDVNGSYDPSTGQVTAGMTLGQVALEAYKTVRFHESSNGAVTGLNAFCHSSGKINEVGYDPQHNFCFGSETEQVATVVNWFRNCLDKKEISQCLSEYSSGAYTVLSYE